MCGNFLPTNRVIRACIVTKGFSNPIVPEFTHSFPVSRYALLWKNLLRFIHGVVLLAICSFAIYLTIHLPIDIQAVSKFEL